MLMTGFPNDFNTSFHVKWWKICNWDRILVDTSLLCMRVFTFPHSQSQDSLQRSCPRWCWSWMTNENLTPRHSRNTIPCYNQMKSRCLHYIPESCDVSTMFWSTWRLRLLRRNSGHPIYLLEILNENLSSNYATTSAPSAGIGNWQ